MQAKEFIIMIFIDLFILGYAFEVTEAYSMLSEHHVSVYHRNYDTNGSMRNLEPEGDDKESLPVV